VIPDNLLKNNYITISPYPSLPQDFSEDETYTVTSETGVSKSRKVRVFEKNILLTNATNGVFSLSYVTNFFRCYKVTRKVVYPKVNNLELDMLDKVLKN